MKKSLGSLALAHPSPVWCVGTYDKDGKPNVATASWSGICCSKPPCVTVSLQKTRYSYNNILEQKAYTISVPSEKYLAEADYFGIASGRKVNKFEVTQLTPARSELVDAPYVAEFPMILECRLVHTYDLGLHTQFIGEIIDVKVDESILDEKGMPDMEKLNTFVYGAEALSYHHVGKQIAKAFNVGLELHRR